MIPKPLHYFNEGLAFALELVALGALAWWGFHTGSGILVHLLLGLGAPAVMAWSWGMIAAPRAKYKIALPLVIVFKVLVFVLSSAAVYATGSHTFALVFGVVALLNTAVATADREAMTRQRDTQSD
ncbi:YrdB family protein [Streptacidiphilus rugosus]|uniref:YrdB family protein n=1 Tax=Streptacidiphilus rugosus TaxID=405783 RepID=UPI000A83B0BB|nr:YrdB family protein [Streptacidiphilus rugosus]